MPAKLKVEPNDPDAVLAAVANAILQTRAPGCSREVWALRAASAVLDALEVFHARETQG